MLSPEINICVCGHAKHGKSTLAGRLMYELGAITPAELERFAKESAAKNAELHSRDFNCFNWIFLKSQHAVYTKGGKLLDPSRTVFPRRGSVTLPDYRLTLIDMPGLGQTFLDNIIYGAYLADFAVLLVEAKQGLTGEKTTWDKRGGLRNIEARQGPDGEQTTWDEGPGPKNIVRILSSFRVPVIGIFVTKMDTIGYSESGFADVKHEIEQHLLPDLQAYHKESPSIVPIAALPGMGINERMEWFSGPSAIDVIRECQTKSTPATARLRFAIEGGKEVYSPPGVGTVLVGSLETGTLRANDELVLEPASTKEQRLVRLHARSLQRPRSVTEKIGSDVASISSRAIVAIATPEIPIETAEAYLSHGGMLGRPDDRPGVAVEIKAELFFFEPDTVYSGKDYFILPNASRGTARIQSIETRTQITFGLDEDKYEVKAGEHLLATLRMDRPICIEYLDEFQRLTRFVLREQNRIVACGRCTHIVA